MICYTEASWWAWRLTTAALTFFCGFFAAGVLRSKPQKPSYSDRIDTL